MSAGLLQIDFHPSARAGAQSRFTRSRQLVLVALCLLWFFPGTIERSLWKPAETHYVPLAYENAVSGWQFPLSYLGEAQSTEPPLYLYVGSKFAQAASGIMEFHAGMRMANLLWLVLGFALIGFPLAQRHGSRAGWRAILLVTGSLGLLLHARTVNPDVSLVLLGAIGLYGSHLLARSTLAGGLVLGLGAMLGFWTVGILALWYTVLLLLIPLVTSSAFLPSSWSRGHTLAILLALLAFGSWQNLLAEADPELLAGYNSAALSKLAPLALLITLQKVLVTICWFTWPSLPLAIMAYVRWHYRRTQQSEVPLGMLGLASGIGALVLAGAQTESAVILLLPALAVFGAAGVQSLSTDVAKMLDRFAILVIGLGMIGFCWFALLALVVGWPSELVGWLASFGIAETASGILVFFAAVSTLMWAGLILRIGRSPERAVLNWVAGMTMGWLVFFLLWGRQIDEVKSYRRVALDMQAALPVDYRCVSHQDVPAQVVAQLGYYSTIKFASASSDPSCPWQVGNASAVSSKVELWRGSRAGDGLNRTLVLYQN